MPTDSLLQQLQQATKGLLYTSESDAPVEAFVWPKADVGAEKFTPDALKKVRHLAPGANVQQDTVANFFAPVTQAQSWHGPEEQATVKRFQALVTMLQSNLSDLHVYKVGDAKQDVYVVGKTPAGDFAGVHTKVVET